MAHRRIVDPLDALEETMADIGHSLKIKYGLARDPADYVIDRWYRRTRELIRGGVGREQAGEHAAREIFPDFRTRVYAGEADTIAWLLDQAGDKK